MAEPYYRKNGATLYHGDCLEVMKNLPDGSIDAVVTDPPYPMIDRPYGKLTEAQWFDLMRGVVGEVRRLLKPTGSAVFVLQPNSERVGRMRTWLWEFMVWVGKEWGIVQDAWWLNDNAMPEVHSNQGGLMRPAVKACVWCGRPQCHRDQDSVLMEESQSSKIRRLAERSSGRLGRRHNSLGGHSVNTLTKYDAAERRGGTTPINAIVTNHGRAQVSAGARGHPAGTPLTLCQWWVKYISPPGGVVLDPFAGSGTVPYAAVTLGRTAIGIEKEQAYCDIAVRRLEEIPQTLFDDKH